MSTTAIKMPTINAADAEQARVELHRDVRYAVIERANDVLNSTIDTYLAARHAHWNVRGPAFLSVHELFGTIASELERQSDNIAERIAGLGGIPDGTVQAVARDTTLAPYPALAISQSEHVEAMSTRLGALATRAIRAAKHCDDEGDPVSAHHLLDVAAKTEKLLWLVESHRVKAA